VPDVVLTTFNARYAHAAFGLRYLLANLGPLRGRSALVEFDVKHDPDAAADAVLANDPRIIGVGVYIWNVTVATRFVDAIKRRRPDVIVVLGGPEVSHEIDGQPIVRRADYVIAGEADLAFRALCERLLNGSRPLMKVIHADLPEFELKPGSQVHGLPSEGLPLDGDGPAPPIALPYDLYDDRDVASRVIYVEASRGCPFKCEFCLSSLDVPVRNVPLAPFLDAMQRLLDRGVRQFKFVDRTFNLNLNVSRPILQFFLDRYAPGLFVHFEMIPDRLPPQLRELIEQFPAGALQFEVGIQTFNPDVAALISRRQDYTKLADNLAWLRQRTGVHVHADLIAGLPGEDVASFGRGFDRLVALGPQEIQVGVLKRLRGTPIVRHDQAWEMVYNPDPPYEVVRTKLIDEPTMLRLKRFATFWDKLANSGNFAETTPRASAGGSPFEGVLALSDWLYERLGRTHAIALQELGEGLMQFLVERRGLGAADVAGSIWRDWRRGGRGDRPAFLKPFVSADEARVVRRRALEQVPKRQARHLA